MSAKRTKARWVVYERRGQEFILLSRRFTTGAKPEKARDRMKALLKDKRISLGVGVVAKE